MHLKKHLKIVIAMNDLSLHIIDIIQNSLKAEATHINLLIEESSLKNLLSIEISDNGCGMTEDQVNKLDDPFFTSRTTRRVGMGVPLFRQSARQSGGDLVVESQPGNGTTVRATFRLDHIDRPPLGDVANSFILMVSSNPGIEFLFRYLYNDNEYIFNTVEVKDILEGIPLNDPAVIRMLTAMIQDNIDDLKNT